MRSFRLLLLALATALALAGCSARREAGVPPVAEPPPASSPPAVEPPPAPPVTQAPGTVTAPWDTAARSRAARRAHVYPKGESALGRKLVAALPDPAGLPPNEGGPPPTPAPAPGTPTAPTSGGDCWQAQILATADRARADRVRSEAAALLGVNVSIVSKDGMHRVRAGGCLDADAALNLVDRARREGWPEAFRVRADS